MVLNVNNISLITVRMRLFGNKEFSMLQAEHIILSKQRTEKQMSTYLVTYDYSTEAEAIGVEYACVQREGGSIFSNGCGKAI